MSKSYEALIHAQVELYGRISRAVENLRKIGAANITTGAVETRLQLLDSNWAKFEAAHDELCTSHWKEIESHAYIKDGTFAEAEESYITQRTAFLDYLNEAKKTDTERDIATQAVARRQLPRIQLPEFTDAILGDVERLHYLKRCLKGEAEQMVRNIPMTSENYQRVWDLLEEHFANKRLLVRACFASLTSMPKMKTESFPDLRKLFHTMLQTVGTLEGIERPIADSDLFVHLITELLDPRSRREWETSISGTSDPPTYEELKTFLEGRLRTLEALHPVPGNFERFQQKSTSTTTLRGQRQSYIGKAFPTSPEKRSSRCVLCSGPHYILSCPEFAKKGPKARRDYASFRQLCFNCFGQHRLATCPFTRSCTICGQRHHSTIHEACVSSPDSGAGGQRITAGAKPTTTIPTTLTSAQPSTTVASTQPREASVLHLHNDLSLHVTILLATARIYVKNRYGQEILVRALIDPGSEVSIISESLAQKLRLPRQPATTAIFGIGGTKSGQAHGCISLDITSSTRSAYKLKVSVFVLPRVSLNSERSVHLSNHWPHLQGLELADPNFQDSDPVEIILGAAVHALIIEDGLRKGNPNSPVAQKTSLGWILSGIATGSTLDSLAIVHLCNTKHDLAKLVMRFWQQEKVEGGAIPQTPDDIWCEKHFIKYHKRLDSGRYMVSLPIREQNSNFLGSRQLSLRMLERMERNFQRKPELRRAVYSVPTKRQVLSETARLFDPLGWLGPVIVRAKILLQSFWLQKIDWDQPLSIKDQETWKIFHKELREIEEISLPRWIYTFSTDCTIEFHGFSDASKKAYAAVVYIRVTTIENNDFKSRIALLQAKTKVAPLKTISLPRLELNAAALLVKLINNIKHGARFQIANIHLWTDSTIALAWIQGHPSRWTTFVANRVTEIQETLPEAQWRHVPGEENPADCASRGLSAVAFKNHPLWWQGPTWLQHTDHLLLRLVGNSSFQTKEEIRPAKAHLGPQTPEENPILLRFSNLQRFLRVCALCRRWLLKNSGKRNEPILPNEIEEIQNYWITTIQAIWFSEEINNLIKNKPLSYQNPLIKFTPVLDEKKLLRVGGRLQHAAISFDSRNPILLPRNSHFTKLIVDTCHRRTLHGGVQLTLAAIRQQYWIIGAQTLVKKPHS
ncbi:uncharacterized protein [Cardiocondyla obscurior]|uniref:uncharacterized protein n=1 Tax=Cardiocondyla obscurior TaxID=286306 RepID=UPI0039658752